MSTLPEALKVDIYNDVCGAMPLSSLTYIWVAMRLLLLFIQLEQELDAVQNKTYKRAYETDRDSAQVKRFELYTSP